MSMDQFDSELKSIKEQKDILAKEILEYQDKLKLLNIEEQKLQEKFKLLDVQQQQLQTKIDQKDEFYKQMSTTDHAALERKRYFLSYTDEQKYELKCQIYIKNMPHHVFVKNHEKLFNLFNVKNYLEIRWKRKKKNKIVSVLFLLDQPIDLLTIEKACFETTGLKLSMSSSDLHINQQQIIKKDVYKWCLYTYGKNFTDLVITQVQNRNSNLGGCCICHDNEGKYATDLFDMIVCCPDENPKCLSALQKEFAEFKMPLFHSCHQNCDKWH